MKVAIYSRVFRPLVGGVETIVHALAAGFAAREGHSVTLLTDTPGKEGDASLPYPVLRRPGLRKMTRWMRESDVVHLAGPAMLPLLAAQLSGRGVAVEHHGFQAACPNGQMFFEPEQKPCPGHFLAERHLECWRCNAGHGWLRSLWMWLLTFPRRWLCLRARANILPTAWLGEVLRLPRAHVIPHGVKMSAAAARPEAHPPPTFLFVGRLVSTKGVSVLLDAAARLRQSRAEFQVRIIGDGPERPRLEDLASSLGLADVVCFLGVLEDAQTEKEMEAATAVVMPSLGGEVFGLVAAESMARGVPVVVSELGSLREIAGDAALLFPPGDSAALAACLRRFLTEPGLAGRLGGRARARAEQEFRLETMIDKHLEVYRN